MIAGIIQVVRDGAATGNANGFVEATHNGTEFTMVGAMAVPDAARLTESVKKLGEARAGNAVELDIATVGDFKLHRIVLAEGFIQAFDDMFGAGREFYVAISDAQAWFSTGPGAQELLTKMIEGLGEPAVSETALSIDAKLHPWINRLYELAEQREMPTAVEKRSAWREDLQLMKQLAESLESDDDFSAILKSG